MTTKTCTKCGETKTVEQFHRNRSKRNGLESSCKTCTAARNRAYNEANRDKISARDRARYNLIGNQGQDRTREVTTRYATRTREPWTPEEDRYLLTGTGTYMDRALQLSRTYKAVARRAAKLRRQDQTA